jgi:formate hydrogenlyase regulatory protein HycA
MTTISELTSKADYISSKANRLRAQWQTYGNTLIKAVTTANKHINHEFAYSETQDIRFRLFDHFLISIRLSEGFFSQNIDYCINLADGSQEANFVAFAHSVIDENGKIDDSITNNDRDAVLQHYLDNISAIYQCIFDALQNHLSVNEELKKLLSRA